MPNPVPSARPSFPFRSLALFVAGAVMLRLLAMAGAVFFPGDNPGPHVARVALPLLLAGGLVALNQRWLARDGFTPDALGLRLTPRRLAWFVVGGLAMTLILVVVGLALGLLAPYQYQRGPLSLAGLAWRSAEYLGGNTGEELIFRGYLLLMLQRHLGLSGALLITSGLFGLFHLPGLSGVAAAKMVCTTFLGGSLYAYGFLLTGTLWTALGLHVIGNIVLHQVLGLSGQPSLLAPAFVQPWPAHYDPGFVVWLVVLGPCLALAAYAYQRKDHLQSLEPGNLEN